MPGNIKGITVEFRANTTPVSKAINKMRTEAKNLDKELGYINKSLKFNPTSVTLWRQKQQVLNESVKDTEKRLDELKDIQSQMDAQGVDKNSAQYRELEREIVKCEDKLKRYKKELNTIPNARLKALSEGFKKVGDEMTKVGKKLTTHVTAPLGLIGAAAAKSFAEVDKVMVLTNSTMGNTEEEAKLLDEAMKTAAANSTYGMTDAATATLNFARAGLDAEQAASALAPAMNLAAGEGGDLDTVSGGLVATINGFHGSFDEAAQYADVFANACNNSALDVDSLSTAMSVAAPIFSSAGYSVNDAALYMGVMANNGIEADKAANSLKTGMARLIDPTEKAADWMEKLGINVTNSDGSLKDSVTVQKELHDAFSNLSESEQIAAASAIFGKNQMAPWLALINTAPGDVTSLATALEAEGTAGHMAADMMSGFGGAIEQLKSGIDVASASLGEALAPTIEKVVGWLQQAIDWFNSLDDETKTQIATIGLVVAAAGPLLVVLGTVISTIGTIMGALGTVKTALLAFSGPVGIAIAIIGGLIAAGVALYKNWDKVKAVATSLVAHIKAKWIMMKRDVTTTFNAIKTTISNVWNNIKTTVGNVVDKIKTTVGSKFDSLKTKVVTAFNSIKEKASSIFNAVKTAITHPIETAVGLIRTAIGKIKSIINTAKLKLPHFKLPHFKISGGKLPWGIGGMGEKPTIGVEWYKNGGIFNKPTIAGLGDTPTGGEAALPLDPFWKKMDKMAGAIIQASSGGNTFNIYASEGMNVKQLAREIEAILVRQGEQRKAAWGY